MGDGVVTFRRCHEEKSGRKTCTGRILVKIPKQWIQGTHKFDSDEVNVTMKPNVVEQRLLIFHKVFLNFKSTMFFQLLVNAHQARKTKKEKTRRKPSVRPTEMEQFFR